MNAKEYILTGFVLFFFGLMGLWVINDSMACVANFGVNSGCGIGNGFWWLTPIQAFHLGLYLTIFSLVLFSFLVIDIS